MFFFSFSLVFGGGWKIMFGGERKAVSTAWNSDSRGFFFERGGRARGEGETKAETSGCVTS